jgi:hypothetical protein
MVMYAKEQVERNVAAVYELFTWSIASSTISCGLHPISRCDHHSARIVELLGSGIRSEEGDRNTP